MVSIVSNIYNGAAKAVRIAQGYGIREFSPQMTKKFKPQFNHFTAEKRYVRGDYEAVLPSGSKLYIHQSYTTSFTRPQRTVLSETYKKLIKPNGETYYSVKNHKMNTVNLYKCNSTGDLATDVGNLQKIK